MRMQIGCCCNPKLFYRNDVSASIPSSNFSNIDAKFAGVTTLLPSTAADLSDCNVYLIGAWGSTKEFPPSGGYDVWNLSATNASVIAAWVAAGGKLIVAVDYRQLLSGTPPVAVGSVISAAYGTSLNNLLSAAGSSLSVTPTNVTGLTPAPPRPTDSFISTSLTSGITGVNAYDWNAGSVISGGTLCFDPNSQNQIRWETVGSGLIVLFGSRNTLWGDTGRTPPPALADWSAMSEFCQRIIDL